MSIANELITRGWTTGTAEEGLRAKNPGAVCLVGAICRAATGMSWWDLSEEETDEVLAPAIAALGFDYVGDVEQWNDAPERTFDEVLRVAKEADEILDA